MTSRFGGILIDEAPTASKFGGIPLDAPQEVQQQEQPPAGFKPAMAAPLEAAAQLGTGMLAEPASGIVGLLSMLVPGAPPAGDVVRSVKEAMTYQPRTNEGKKLVPDLVSGVLDATPEIIKKPIAATGQAYSHLENWVADNYGPEAATAVATLPTALLEAIPAGLAIKKMRGMGTPEPAVKIAPEVPSAPPAIAPITEQYQDVSSALKSGSAEKLAPEIKPDKQIMKDAEDLGIDLNPSHYSTNRAYIDMEQALKSRPGSLLSTVENKAIVDLGTKADDLIETLGGQTDKSILDSGLRSEFDSTISGLEKHSDLLYTKVEESIPKATKIKANYTRDFIKGQLKDLGGNESLLTSAEKKLADLIETRPTYAAIDRVRKDIGSAIGKRSGPFKDDDVGQLKQLYAVLSQDQEGVAKAFGVGDDFSDAKKLVSKRKDLEDQAITLLGKDLQGSLIPKMRQSATALTKGDVSSLNKLMDSVPEGRKSEVAATMLNDLFAAGARRNAPLGQGFMNAFAGLNRNPGAKAALFRHLPAEAEKRFDMLGRVSTGLYSSKALENTSKTARDVISAMDSGGLLAKMYGIGKAVAAAEGVSTSVGMPGLGTAGVIGSVLAKGSSSAAKKADELLSSQAFRDAMKLATQGSKESAEKKISLTPEYQAWLKAQNPKVQKQIAAVGLIPFLTSDEDNKPERK